MFTGFIVAAVVIVFVGIVVSAAGKGGSKSYGRGAGAARPTAGAAAGGPAGETAARRAGITGVTTPAEAATRPAEAGRPVGAAADAVEAADTGQLSSTRGNRIPSRHSGRAPVGPTPRRVLARSGVRMAAVAYAVVEQLSSGAL